MSKQEFQNEKLYQATMHIARRMLASGLISEADYRKIEEIFLEEYHPVLGALISDLSLTSIA